MSWRRLHIRIDEERYRRLTALARSRGMSIAAVVREAIDASLQTSARVRRKAARTILAADPMPVPRTKRLREELEEFRAGRSGRATG